MTNVSTPPYNLIWALYQSPSAANKNPLDPSARIELRVKTLVALLVVPSMLNPLNPLLTCMGAAARKKKSAEEPITTGNRFKRVFNNASQRFILFIDTGDHG